MSEWSHDEQNTIEELRDALRLETPDAPDSLQPQAIVELLNRQSCVQADQTAALRRRRNRRILSWSGAAAAVLLIAGLSLSPLLGRKMESTSMGTADCVPAPPTQILESDNGEAYAPETGSNGSNGTPASGDKATTSENTIRVLTASQVADMVDEGALLLDLRSPEAFQAGSLAGAVNLPLESLETDIAAYAHTNQTILLYGGTQDVSRTAAATLQALGYTEVIRLSLAAAD